MKKTIYVLIFSLMLMACKSTSVKNETKNNLEMKSKEKSETTLLKNYYFKGGGNEPFWNLAIGTKEIVFKSLIQGFEEMTFKSVVPIRAMDANVKLYKLKNKEVTMDVTILQKECTDSRSGKASSYLVKVEYKLNSDIDFIKMEGCGNYITDYRLHDIWALDSLRGKKVSSLDFADKLPYIEINSAENAVMGFAGCNDFHSKIFSENKLLRFTSVISTLKACIPTNKEDEFLKALQSVTTYSLENNRLSLSNPSGGLLVFRKVD